MNTPNCPHDVPNGPHRHDAARDFSNSTPTTVSPRSHLVYAHGFDEVITSQGLMHDGRPRRVSEIIARLLDAARSVDETALLRPRRTATSLDRIEARDFGLTLQRFQKDWDLRLQCSARALHFWPEELWDTVETLHRVVAGTRLPGIHVARSFSLAGYALHADHGWLLDEEGISHLPTVPKQRIDKSETGDPETVYQGKFGTLYDKVAEIRKHPHKAYIEAIWRANGWLPGDPATRFEVRPMKRKRSGPPSFDFGAEWRDAVRLLCPRPRGSDKRRFRMYKVKGRIHPAWQPLLSLSFKPPWEGGNPPAIAMPKALPPERLTRVKIGSALDSLGYLAAAAGCTEAQIDAIITNTPLAQFEHLRRPNEKGQREDLLDRVNRHAAKYGFEDPRLN